MLDARDEDKGVRELLAVMELTPLELLLSALLDAVAVWEEDEELLLLALLLEAVLLADAPAPPIVIDTESESGER